MEQDERQREILSRARAEGQVQVAALAQELAVAPETVRRDLRDLAEQGLLRRTHGGAHPVESAGFESGLPHRTTSMVAEKHRIAEAAVRLLGGAESVFIDEGVTPQMVAEAVPRAIRPGSRLTVVTSSVIAASALADCPDITLIMLGGRVRQVTLGVVDHWALRMLSELVIDLAFIGANGISSQHGLTTPDPAVAAVKGAVVSGARRKVFVGVHAKFGIASFCRFADVPDFEAIVTDTGLSASDAHRYSALGPHVIRA